MILTRSQRVAQAAYAAVMDRTEAPCENAEQQKKTQGKYLSFARAFPTLIHTCGLAQATAFALAKGDEQRQVLDDLARVLRREDGRALHTTARGETPDAAQDGHSELMAYLRLSREALFAATWIKRYAEALLVLETEGPG